MTTLSLEEGSARPRHGERQVIIVAVSMESRWEPLTSPGRGGLKEGGGSEG